jgi:hypothetical protein
VNSYTDHQLLAAVRVARMMDQEGNTSQDTTRAFPLVMSQGEHRSDDLHTGLAILTAAAFMYVDGDQLTPTPTLILLASLPDEQAVRHLRRVFADRASALSRIESGVAGETAVVDACCAELVSLDRPDLAAKVMRLSLLDDTLGYDVSAPTLTDQVRLLEVKTAARPTDAIFPFFLSRNEFDIGRRERAWALVACNSTGGQAGIIGWCRASALVPYLPDDRRGRWTEAFLQLPRSVLLEGIPPAV